MFKIKRNYRENTARRVFKVFNYCFCCLTALLCLAPMIHVMALSLSASKYVNSGMVLLVPKGLQLTAYKDLLAKEQFFISMWISVKRVLLGLVINMTVIILASYPLSKRSSEFAGRQVYVWIFIFSMLFGAGLIPTYLIVANTGLLNTIWALILPGAVQVSNIILLQNFMKALPDEISEAAFIDGAGHWRTLTQVILPLCKPSLAAISLFVMVGHWNDWFAGSIYMQSYKDYPLQTYLQTQIIDWSKTDIEYMDPEMLALKAAQSSTRSAQMFLAMIPILCVYPFLQKHFTKGIVMGSVKG
ncbi:MAG: carbohydrate ABC transporter permease [Clostridia bacterium]|nr:carbohydrate ABC transporter permease [Clostridia bacterium]